MSDPIQTRIDASRLLSGACEPDNLGSAYHDSGSCWSLIRAILEEHKAVYERDFSVTLEDLLECPNTTPLFPHETVAGMFKKLWSDEQCYELNAIQQVGNRHPYTCGNNSRHRNLIATPFGWKCADCDYFQNWSHETGGPNVSPTS